mgnify:CR=1 FL=1
MRWPDDLTLVLERVRRADDVVYVAVLPDVHLAADVCVGTATATRRLVYPSAVGGDIGCGMLAIAFDASADLLADADVVLKVRKPARDALDSGRVKVKAVQSAPGARCSTCSRRPRATACGTCA